MAEVKDHHTRVLPDGTVPPLSLDSDEEHRIVIHAEGGEDPQAMVPESGAPEAGVSLPRLGEKFAVNPVMGTGSASIGFGLPPGRTLTPAVGLSYDSSGENGPFGLGWAASVPFFQRATSRPHLRPDDGNPGRGVPTYDDPAQSDVFVFSDAAELVEIEPRPGQEGFAVFRYRPRIESGFVRIERWEKGGVSHWRVTSRDNVTSVFGLDPTSQVVDPDDDKRVFRWNLEAQIDPLGNAVVYQYEKDDAQSYLARVLYCNRKPLTVADVAGLAAAAPEDFLFEVLLDWSERSDPFVHGRAGFEIPTRRLCRGVRVVHRIGDGAPDLVARTALEYDDDPVASRLVSVQRFGADAKAAETALPARTFEYSAAGLTASKRTIPASGLEGLDLSKPLTDAEFLDLHGTAVSGLLVRQLGKFIWRARVAGDRYAPPETLAFGASASTSEDPHRQRFFDLDLDGRPALVEIGPSGGEVWERNATDDGWAAGKAIASVPPEAKRDKTTGFPRVLWGDLDGDGRTDALVVESEGGAPQWWRFEGLDRGWEVQDTPAGEMLDAEAIALLGAKDEVLVLADVTGDGLPDLVRLSKDEVAVWRCLGHGQFSKKRVLDAPGGLPLNEEGHVDPTRFRLLDVLGTGGVDILVLGDSSARLWVNQCGNRFVAGPSFSTPHPDELALSSLTRLDGRGTGSFAFAKAEPDSEITVIEFVAGEAGLVRPGLLVREENGMGLRTEVRYAASTAFLPGPNDRKWLTRLPHSVPVVTHLEHRDLAAGVRFASTLRYGHGCWDGHEREFRGFGFVEQDDAEDFDRNAKGSAVQSMEREHFSPPVRTKSWFHTGVELPSGSLDEAYRVEYSDYDPQVAELSAAAYGPEEARALKGSLLHTEAYALAPPQSDDDAKAKASRPFAITTHGYRLHAEIREDGKHHPSLFPVSEQSLSYTYDRKPEPDPRVAHNAVLELDDHGNVRKSIDVAYPRRKAVPEPIPPDGPVTPPSPPKGGGVRARLVGFMFDEAKNFILPEARAGMKGLAAIYQDHPDSTLVVIGHTDRVGQPDDNAALSLGRAASVAAFLRDDVDAWLEMYEPHVGWPAQWGDVEDRYMLHALGYDDVQAFQAAHGLAAGPIDRATREVLVRGYMDLDGTSIPAGVTVEVVGAGEFYPEVDTADGVDEPRNRRVELFFFDESVEPPVPGDLLGAGGSEYDAWLAAMERTVDVSIETGDIDDPAGAEDIDWGAPQLVDPDLGLSEAPTDDPQLRTEIVLSEAKVFNCDEPDHYRVGAPLEALSRAVEGQSGDSTAPFSIGALAAMAGKTVLSRSRVHYFDDKADARIKGAVGKLGLVQATEEAAFSEEQFQAAFAGDNLAAEKLAESKYVKDAGLYWVISGTTEHAGPEAFRVPLFAADAFGNYTALEYDADHYFVRAITDPKQNVVRTEYDARTLAPSVVTDPSGAKSFTEYDALGLPTKTWREGVLGEGGTADQPAAIYSYDLHAFAEGRGPISQTIEIQFDHARTSSRRSVARSTKVKTAIAYFDGSGGLLQSKVRDPSGKWRTSPSPLVNNKGAPVRTFEPTIGGVKFAHGGGGVVQTIRYDELGQPIRTEYADGSVERVEYDAWQTRGFDRNDTALEEAWTPDGASPEDGALLLATLEQHRNTPTLTRLDVLGRPVASFDHLEDGTKRELHVTRTHYDPAGNAFEVIDARGNVAEKRRFGLGGLVLQSRCADAGVQASLPDIDGGLLYSRRGAVGQGNAFFSSYDELRRPITDFVQADGVATAVAVKHRVYVDTASAGNEVPEGSYHRGRLFRVYDGGGRLTFRDYDFDGNPVETERVLPSDPKVRPDWTALVGKTSIEDLDAAAADKLEDREFFTIRDFDAMGRAVRVTNADGSEHQVEYREDGFPHRVRRAKNPADLDPDYDVVHEVTDYDALGRATAVRRGKAVTTYAYDRDTRRLRSIATKAAGKTVQSLQYTYDPVGNVVSIRDNAQKSVTTGGAAVEPVQRFRYDSLYRLIEATGREHHGQVAGGETPDGAPPLQVAAPNDATAVRNYTQRYAYDETGNLLQLSHRLGPRHSAAAWTRRYHYSAFGNRLRGTAVGRTPTPEFYPHDELGRITAMPHLDALAWDEGDQLVSVKRGTMTLHFQYVDGARIRKWVEKGGTTEERVYLGGVEVFRKSAGGTVKEETTTEHVPGGLVVETKTVRDGKDVASPKPLFRYQLGNHLGSVSLELDEDGLVISYEEYHPYGTTSYRAVRGDVDAEVNRYRFTGMERDEETGLAQHGARYYASWLGRWASADPIGLGGGINRYAYCRGSPVTLVDRGGTRPCDPDEMPEVDACDPSDAASNGDGYGTGVTERWEEDLGPSPTYQHRHYAPASGAGTHGRRNTDENGNLPRVLLSQDDSVVSMLGSGIPVIGPTRDAARNFHDIGEARDLGEVLLFGTIGVVNTAFAIADVLTLGKANEARMPMVAFAKGGGNMARHGVTTEVALLADAVGEIQRSGRRAEVGALRDAAGSPVEVVVHVRHRTGNTQLSIAGRRWNLPKGEPIGRVPLVDPVGDALQEAATAAAQRWSPRQMSPRERLAVARARRKGEAWRGNLLQAQARGRWVEEQLRSDFSTLAWGRVGPDVTHGTVAYDIMSGTVSNINRHGRRMDTVLFRFITF